MTGTRASLPELTGRSTGRGAHQRAPVDADALILAHIGKAKALGRQLSRRQDDGDDIVSEALVALVAAAHSYRGDRATTFWTWAGLQIWHHLQDYRRASMRRGGWRRKQGPDGRDRGWTQDYTVVSMRHKWLDDDESSEWDRPDPAPSPERQAIIAGLRQRYLSAATTDRARTLAALVLDGATQQEAGRSIGVKQTRASQLIADITQRCAIEA